MSEVADNKTRHTLGYALVPPPTRADTRRGACFAANSARLFPTESEAAAARTQYSYDFEIVEVWVYV